MPEVEGQKNHNDDSKPSDASISPAPSRDWRDIFTLPAPVKRVFESFPLVVYPANRHPLRSPRQRESHKLYVFTSEDGALSGAPSFNPSCLKWQAYLKFCGIAFHTVQSNNHASPSGALPFLIPGQVADTTVNPIAANRLQRWSKEQGKAPEEPDRLRVEAYMALLDHRIRRAWVCAISDQYQGICVDRVLALHALCAGREFPSGCAATLCRANVNEPDRQSHYLVPATSSRSDGVAEDGLERICARTAG